MHNGQIPPFLTVPQRLRCVGLNTGNCAPERPVRPLPSIMSCPDCFTGHVHDGKPRGVVMKFHGLDTYVTDPTDGRPVRGIIVIIPDAFGWEFVNNRLLADHYAEKGDYRVYLPDFMNGQYPPESRARESIRADRRCRMWHPALDAGWLQGLHGAGPVSVQAVRRLVFLLRTSLC